MSNMRRLRRAREKAKAKKGLTVGFDLRPEDVERFHAEGRARYGEKWASMVVAEGSPSETAEIHVDQVVDLTDGGTVQ